MKSSMKREFLGFFFVLVLGISIILSLCTSFVSASTTTNLAQALAPTVEPYEIQLHVGVGRVLGSLQARVSDVFVSMVETTSKGRIKVKTFWPEEVYSTAEDMFAAVSAGATDAAFVSSDRWVTGCNLPEHDIWLAVPYTVDIKTMWQNNLRFWNDPEAGALLRGRMKEQGGINFALLPGGPVVLMLKKKVNNVEELRGLKVRVFGVGPSAIAEAVGMVPVPIAWSEVPMALKTGVIDALITDFNGMDLVEWYNEGISCWLYNIPTYMVCHSVIFSTKRWNNYPEDVKTILEEVREPFNKAAQEMGWEMINNIENEYRAGMKDVVELPEDEISKWIEKVRELAYPRLEKINPQLWEHAKRIYGF